MQFQFLTAKGKEKNPSVTEIELDFLKRIVIVLILNFNTCF